MFPSGGPLTRTNLERTTHRHPFARATTTTLCRDAGGRRQGSCRSRGEGEGTHLRALATKGPGRAARALICDSTSPRTRFGGPRGREIQGGGAGGGG
ncbi:unnamed protein product, partial [Ectocarpus sp. 13 AM-2016]